MSRSNIASKRVSAASNSSACESMRAEIAPAIEQVNFAAARYGIGLAHADATVERPGFDAQPMERVGEPQVVRQHRFLAAARAAASDVLWGLAIAVALAVVLNPLLAAARRIASYVAEQPLTRTVLCAVGAAACAALYALVTGRSPAEVALSGQATLASMAANPQDWDVGPLLAVLVFKGVAYTLCLGSLRGGPVFPALFLGAAVGVLLAPLPGLGLVPAMAAGMAAGTAITLGRPVSSVLLVALLVGNVAVMPVVILAAVVAFVITELLPRGRA